MSYIGNEPIVSATRTVTEVTATAGQTLFTANGGYTVGFLDVFINGSKLTSADFTATDGSTVTLTEAAQVSDIVRLEALGTFLASNGVAKTGDTMTGQLTLQRAGGSAGSGNNLYVNVTSSYGGISVNSTANNNSFVELLEAGTKVGGFNADTTNNVTSVQSDGGHALAFNTAGTTERMRIDASGNVGIGTSSPQNQLHINGTSTGYARFQSSNRTFTIGSLASAYGFVINDVDSGQQVMQIDAAGLFKFNSGYGSAATAYGVRAWVDYNGSTGSVISSGNVSSVTRNGPGDWSINFTNSIVDANYSIASFVKPTSGQTDYSRTRCVQGRHDTAPATTYCRVSTVTSGAGQEDNDTTRVIFVR